MSSRSSLPRLVARLAGCWLCLAAAAFAAPQEAAGPLVLEAEDIPFPANWVVDQDGGASGGAFLRATDSATDALAPIDVPVAGDYAVWTHSRDFAAEKPGSRHYRVVIDGAPVAQESAVNLRDGWSWEKVGTVSLAAGRHMLGLRDTTRYWARCDCIVLAPGNFDPSAVPLKSLAAKRIVPVLSAVIGGGGSEAALRLDEAHDAATLESDAVRVVFQSGKDATGAPRVIRHLYAKEEGEGSWRPVPFDPAGESLFLLRSADGKITHKGAAPYAVSDYFPHWPTAQPFPVEVAGKTYQIGDTANPFAAGASETLDAVAVRQAAPDRVEIDYAGRNGTRATGVWTLEGDVQWLSVSLRPASGGWYSLGFSPFQPWARDRVAAVQLPPLFQMQRLPDRPTMMTSSTTPQALALLQIAPETAGGTPFTYLVAGDAQAMPYEWPRLDNATCGFSLLNGRFQPQPTVFAPVLGLRGSRVEAGGTLAVRFAAISLPGDWTKGMAAASDEIFRVADYRQPIDASLTGAVLNLIDLLKDADASGWNARLKGAYNIESEDTVSQCSPMTYLSAALLTRDPDFYASRALPALEYTLSRRGAHFAPKLPDPSPYISPDGLKLTYPGGFFGGRYWEGVYEMTQGLNPWIKDLVHDASGRVRHGGVYGSGVPEWSEMLGAYRLDPRPETLDAIRKSCDAWLAQEMYARKTTPLGVMPFCNAGMYPYWWDLPDIYELTGDKKYLDAAAEGAFYTIAGTWSHPAAPDGDITIHPTGQFPGSKYVWWKGTPKFRLGYPRKPNDTPAHQVPAWEVSPVGLSQEQPETFLIAESTDGSLANISNLAWAPTLLRVAALTHRDIFQTYARNAIIGRFASFGGYYAVGMTDLTLRADYPYKGPDISTIYYHHIPAHLAYALDYLFAEAEQASGGKVAFPWVRQQGYVWMTNREFGAAPGKVYDDSGLRPWLDRRAFSIPSPQIDYLGAIGGGVLDIVVTNTSNSDAQTVLQLDPDRTGVRPGDAYEFLRDGKVASSGHVSSEISFSLPPRALGVLRFKTSRSGELPALKPLAAVPVHLDLPAPWNRLHAIRIRSPFGGDAVYAYVESGPLPGAQVQFAFEDGREPLMLSDAPYDFSVPVPSDRELAFHLVLRKADGSTTVSPVVRLPGT